MELLWPGARSIADDGLYILPHTYCAAATSVNIEKQSAYYVIKIADQFFASFLTD